MALFGVSRATAGSARIRRTLSPLQIAALALADAALALSRAAEALARAAEPPAVAPLPLTSPPYVPEPTAPAPTAPAPAEGGDPYLTAGVASSEPPPSAQLFARAARAAFVADVRSRRGTP